MWNQGEFILVCDNARFRAPSGPVNPLLIAGVLIVGGNPHRNKAELYVPNSNESCSLPSLPDYRWYHTVSEGGLLCGGWDTYNEDNCLLWSPSTGSWEKALTLDIERHGHVSWTPSSGTTGTYLMGGYEGGKRSTTLITNDRSLEPGFPLKYSTA